MSEITCPSCNAVHSMGAKFCSNCRTPLASNGTPVPPPPIPPPRPNLGGMVGQMGGKTETRQVAADASAAYDHILNYISMLPGSVISRQLPPQQVSAKVAYKDMISTSSMVIKVDTSVTVAPIGGGQCSVTVTTKTDNSSTGKVWIIFGCCGLLAIMLSGFFWMQTALFFILAAGLGLWMLSTHPGNKVTEKLLEDLNANLGNLQSAPVPSPATPQTPIPPKDPFADNSPDIFAGDDTPGDLKPQEDDVMGRIKKLAELRDIGAISVEDFESKKDDLLSRM